jgi:hypothetical protein
MRYVDEEEAFEGSYWVATMVDMLIIIIIGITVFIVGHET